MNAIGIALIWCAVQVTLLGLLTAGLYLLARWLRPAAAPLVVLSGLATIVVLSLVSISPWPCWSVVQQWRSAAIAARDSAVAEDSFAAASPAPAAASSSSDTPLERSPPQPLRRAIVEDFLDPPAAGAASAWRWPAMAAVTLLVGMACGLVWLALGLLAVRTHRARSRPVHDRELSELIDVLCAELGCTQTIEVRQSEHLVTAAMIGWRRPALLLAPDWKTWTAEERRAVLAHEIAHARSRDCLTALCGQVALMLHVYHPLLHWLAGRLRLEQELAADAAAASVSGGQRQYLMTIAALALRQQDRPLSWPARTFLPTRTTFLRRIAMLRDNKKLIVDRLSPGVRLIAVGAVLLAGLAAAGLRGPAGPSAAVAAAPARTAKDASKGLVRLSYVGKTSDDKRSLAGSGHAIAFRRPAAAKHLVAVQIYASRYGMPQPPQEDFHLYVLDKDRKTLHEFLFPYGLVARGEQAWCELRLPAAETPEEFYIALSFSPHQTKGIYLGLDRNVEQSHSYMGLPGQGFTPVPEKYDWMVEAFLTSDPKKHSAPRGPNVGRRAAAAAEKPARATAANPADAVKEAVERISTMAETDPKLPGVLESLKGLDAKKAVAETAKFLDSKEDNVRRAAVYILWRGGFKSIEPAVPRLLRLCEHDEDLTRGMAAIALGANHAPKSLPVLLKMTAEDRSGFSRRCAAFALGLLGDKAALPTLKKALQDPESMVRHNAQAALRMLEPPPTHTQRMTSDIQPDGTIRFSGTMTVYNDSNKDMAVYGFVNSDFVKLEKITDAAGKPVAFEAQHKGNTFQYRLPLAPPLPPSESREFTTEGTETTLIKPGDEPGTFVYQMKHWPAVSGETRRIEVHRLPPGAELLGKSPQDMVQSRKDNRIELRIERTIPAGGSLEVSYRYRLKPGG